MPESIFDTEDFLRRSKLWSPEIKAKMAARAAELASMERKAWYCDRPGTCDGEPHGAFTYPHARGDQWQPAGIDWFLWLIMSGRGSGKTRTGSEWVRSITKYVERIAGIGRRGVDFRATMIEGDSGLIKACENAGMAYDYQPSKKEFRFDNGATLFGYSAEEPDSLRGPQHGAAWMDEPAHYDLLEDVWDNLLFGLRLPGLPGGAKILATSTPLPSEWITARVDEETTRVARVSTYANLRNLDPAFQKMILDRYEGTRLGRQELHGEILPDVEGALWNTDIIRPTLLVAAECERIIVAIDPAGSTNKKSDLTGIIVVGKKGNEYVVLADFSGKYSPNGWAAKALQAFDDFRADAIVAEKNFGGDMVKATLDRVMEETGRAARILITTASRSKELRAEPVVALYEQGRVGHVKGMEKLEKEQLEWVPGKGKSPNRVDALVHGITELAQIFGATAVVSPVGRSLRGIGATSLNAPRVARRRRIA